MQHNFSVLHIFLGLTALFLVCSSPLKGHHVPFGFAEKQIAAGLDPTDMAIAPDGRIFLTEKNGKVLIIEDEQLLPSPFLVLSVDNYNERGLGAIALDPNFEQNNYIYLFYTVLGGNYNRISRFTANGNYALPGSEVVLLNLDVLSGAIHNGGTMQFGTDGKLYIATGDGANAANAQDFNNLLGKILRINSDGTIPTDNPFYNQTTGKNRAIWALGFRNPFTFAVQASTGLMYANDVGSDQFEEVNDVRAGKNYGWNVVEGFVQPQNPFPANYQDPVYAYSHEEGCAVIGAAFYDPVHYTFPSEYHGLYFFADYCGGYIKTFNTVQQQLVDTFAFGIDRPIRIVVAPNGDLYYIARGGMGGGTDQDNTSSLDGAVWRVRYVGNGAPSIAIEPQDVLVAVGDTVSFKVATSGSDTILARWYRDGVAIADGIDFEYVIAGAVLSDSGSVFQCVIANALGADTSAPAVLHVTSNTRPVVSILQPLANATYRAGEILLFSGTAVDAENGNLPDSAFSWRVDFHHNEHTHPALPTFTGSKSGYYDIPTMGEIDDNVWYRVHLTAKDAGGLTRRAHRDVHPLKTNITIRTNTPALSFNADGKIVQSPHSFISVQGIIRHIEVPALHFASDSVYFFERWSNGQTTPLLVFQASPTDTTFRAIYKAVAYANGTGILGRYFYTEELTDMAFIRIDTTINFNWGAEGTPIEGQPDNFSVRWTGKITPILTGNYTFHTFTDDGVRLWVDNQQLIDAWYPQAVTEHTGQLFLSAGKWYPIVMEFYEARYDATVSLQWSTDVMKRTVIPRSQLLPDDGVTDLLEIGTVAYPVPAENFLNVSIYNNKAHELTYRIWNVAGQLMMENTQTLPFEPLVLQINVQALTTGVYYLELVSDNGKIGRFSFIKG